ncbi:VOC family protein [Pontivivens ytuae]|uniref:VOC family protein n=1 Tax=Pontivivens ytuae TaxID=2789856 RepID=A0A7S9LQY2_9RHOB|nr:VOC family protein [Pontivivens ytuae]QPH53671.1 VOC family protein [Pontivivens ytuae]
MARPHIVPYLSYRDAKAAMAFLTEAFGLTTVTAYEDAGVLQHGEMAWRDGLIMLGTAEIAPSVSPGIYLVVEDVDAHHARAVKAGAEIVYGPEDTPFGTRRYRAKDPEGHEWSFGTYAPDTEAN